DQHPTETSFGSSTSDLKISKIKGGRNDPAWSENSAVCIDRRRFGDAVGRDGDGSTGASAGLLRVVDRKQPLYERAVRILYAGPRLCARQRQAGQQYSDRRPAGEYRRDQVRQRTDPLRYRLETAGLPQDDRIGSLGPARRATQASGFQRC